MSTAGGAANALKGGAEIGCAAIQIFSKNSNQWRAKALSAAEAEEFRRLTKELGIWAACVHDSYLINLGSPIEAQWRKSVEAFYIEMQRAEALGFSYLVAHPGAHLGEGETPCLARIATSLNELFDRTGDFHLRVLLEVTAGQGSCVGQRFEHIRDILAQIPRVERIGVCVDTCHIFAAGYDIRNEEGYRKTLEQFDRIVGPGYLLAFHLNDSKKGLNSRVDRHEHIGEGLLGLEPFRLLVNDSRFEGTPMILETPKGADRMMEDRRNLETLRRLIGRTDPIPSPSVDTPFQPLLESPLP